MQSARVTEVSKNHFHFGLFPKSPSSVLEWAHDCQAAFRGDAHHQEGLEVHQYVLQRVPHIWDEHDEQLVLEVEIKALCVDNEDDNEDDVDDRQSDEGVVEVGFHLWPCDKTFSVIKLKECFLHWPFKFCDNLGKGKIIFEKTKFHLSRTNIAAKLPISPMLATIGRQT